MTLESIARMPEAEFLSWGQFAARRLLPWRRIELMLAQLTMYVAVTMGGAKNCKISDFLFDVDGHEEPTADEELAYFGFQPRGDL